MATKLRFCACERSSGLSTASNFQNVNACEEKFVEYLANRRALGYERPEALENFYEQPKIRKYCETFALSRLDIGWTNAIDNGLVFVETGVGFFPLVG